MYLYFSMILFFEKVSNIRLELHEDCGYTERKQTKIKFAG